MCKLHSKSMISLKVGEISWFNCRDKAVFSMITISYYKKEQGQIIIFVFFLHSLVILLPLTAKNIKLDRFLVFDLIFKWLNSAIDKEVFHHD